MTTGWIITIVYTLNERSFAEFQLYLLIKISPFNNLDLILGVCVNILYSNTHLTWLHF